MPNFQGPGVQFTPQMLAQMAQAAFRPPAPMQAAPMPGLPSVPQAPAGPTLKDGIDAINMGLQYWKPSAPSPISPQAAMAAYAAAPTAYTKPGFGSGALAPGMAALPDMSPAGGTQVAFAAPVDFLSNASGRH